MKIVFRTPMSVIDRLEQVSKKAPSWMQCETREQEKVVAVNVRLRAVEQSDQQNGKSLPEPVEGKLVARVSLGLDVMARLQDQVQRVFENMRQAQANEEMTQL